jgi:signal transduction histidine kinase
MLVNLLENGLQYAGPGRRIEVRVAGHAGKPEVVVADNGPGIPAAERDRVVERFYRLEASRSTPGSGLGLALVSAVAGLHGMRLTLGDNAPGLIVRIA